MCQRAKCATECISDFSVFICNFRRNMVQRIVRVHRIKYVYLSDWLTDWLNCVHIYRNLPRRCSCGGAHVRRVQLCHRLHWHGGDMRRSLGIQRHCRRRYEKSDGPSLCPLQSKKPVNVWTIRQCGRIATRQTQYAESLRVYVCTCEDLSKWFIFRNVASF